jgi:imidazole glycerol-phosphate synthase subunit HisH
MKIAIIKYNAGNIQSVKFALERIGVSPVVTDQIEELRSADKIIFPGVGEASSAMRYLRERKLDQFITTVRQPLLGICLGMQLLCQHSEEGNTDCMGIFDQKVKKFVSPETKGANNRLKIPQIGWNTIEAGANTGSFSSPLLKNIAPGEYMYFVHSYYAELGKNTIGTTRYIMEYSSMLQKDNFYAVQFHPEKSSRVGQQLLENFIACVS